MLSILGAEPSMTVFSAQRRLQMADRHRRLRVLAAAAPGLLDRTSVSRARHESSSHRAFDLIQP